MAARRWFTSSAREPPKATARCEPARRKRCKPGRDDELGIPVPAGFTITTEVCTDYYNNDRKWPEGLEEQIRENIAKVEKAMGAEFGSAENPLLLSVRSGARVSMPGMMDTILNLGLNDAAVEGLIKKSNNPRFAYDSYRRFIQMYGDVVLGVEHAKFERLIDADEGEAGRRASTPSSTQTT